MQAMHVPHEDPGRLCLNESCIMGGGGNSLQLFQPCQG